MNCSKSLLVILFLFTVLFESCTEKTNTSISLEDYQPIDEFVPAYQALSKQNKDYDIEETIRIINSLEIAQAQSDDFYSYLEYLAKQDYSLVSEDVMEAKAKLLPILQQMFKLQKENEELSTIWVIARSMASGTKSLIKNSNPVGAVSLFNLLENPLAILDFAENMGINDAKLEAFGQYEKEMNLKASLVKEIEELKSLYLDYLNDFAPIYHKYMKEWDRLCVNKDKAYLDIYSGRMVDGYNSASEILKEYPLNREALLLKSLSLINIGSGQYRNSTNNLPTIALQKEVNLPDSLGSNMNEYYNEALITIDNYISHYPNRSAPALVLKGLLANHLGKAQQALSFFDQAAIEYPRQAVMLTDLLDSYINRTYLNKTPEGQYLLKLYRSTMEGYGMFSPNLLKAKYYAEKGMIDKSKNEIFNHFFRRGNQGIYDCLLSDMQFCEEYLYNSFRQLLMERSYLDIEVKPETDWKFTNKDNEINIAIHNRSDIDLENIRVFLCLHYTDMYKDEYDVVKIPAKNIVKHHQKETLGTVKLDYQNKTYNDITRIRAIVMTDDCICWIDNADYKKNNAAITIQSSENQRKKSEEFLKALSLNISKIEKAITKNISVNGGVNNKSVEVSKEWLSMKKVKEIGSTIAALWDKEDNKLNIELPRILTFIEPVFSIHEIQDEKAILPIDNYLVGSSIRLRFDYEPQVGEILPLYIYSEFAKLKVDISYDGKDSKIIKIASI